MASGLGLDQGPGAIAWHTGRLAAMLVDDERIRLRHGRLLGYAQDGQLSRSDPFRYPGLCLGGAAHGPALGFPVGGDRHGGPPLPW